MCQPSIEGVTVLVDTGAVLEAGAAVVGAAVEEVVEAAAVVVVEAAAVVVVACEVVVEACAVVVVLAGAVEIGSPSAACAADGAAASIASPAANAQISVLLCFFMISLLWLGEPAVFVGSGDRYHSPYMIISVYSRKVKEMGQNLQIFCIHARIHYYYTMALLKCQWHLAAKGTALRNFCQCCGKILRYARSSLTDTP